MKYAWLWILSLLFADPVWAQSQSEVVAACGTAPGNFQIGQVRPNIMDLNGNLCTGANFSGSVTATSAANVQSTLQTISGNAQPLNQSTNGGLFTQPVFGSTIVSLAAGLPVQPATGSTFAISAAALPLPAGAATQAGLTTINTTLGSPFQSGGALGAGGNIIGKVGIDQTAAGVTNGVSIAPTSAAAAAITPIRSTVVESGHVLKASPGNLYSLYATIPTGVTGWVMSFDSTTIPADGAVTPVECVYVAGPNTVTVNFETGPMDKYATGIAVAFSSTGCFTKTASVNAFFKGRVM